MLAQRLRLEQRFINSKTAGFSQRLRYYINDKIPFINSNASFIKGAYVALQDEIFVNIKNKQNSGGSFLDQNRSYGALGYRFSKKVDLELGYQNQYVKDNGGNTSNNITQIALYTRL